uniref:GATA-type domain-containing protein n=1 Tax=Meloidogyne incognita TaxID=6306 RepID=A0A914N2M7_MELIC
MEIGNKISGVNEGNLRNCFNCGAKQSKLWHNYLKQQYLCHVCGEYKRKFGKIRPRKLWFKTKKRITQDRKCCICETTSTSRWYCHSEHENYLCGTCYKKQYRAKLRTNKTERKNKNK